MQHMGECPSVSQVVVASGRGEPAVLEHLTPQVYRELYELARACLRRRRPYQPLPPTALNNEAYLRLRDQAQPVQWENWEHFFGIFGISARLMHIIAVDHAHARHAARRGGAAAAITLDDCMAVVPGPAADVLELDEALDRLAAVDELKAKVIELHYIGCVDREELAVALGLTVPALKRGLRLRGAWPRRFLASKCRRRAV
jgi:RNA polymerase sigma-70 factor, ECF subfamily